MRKNVASQTIGAQLVSATDGSNVTTGTTTVSVTGDAGTQGAGGGSVVHEGNGYWSYAPTQAETNYNHVAFTFTNNAAVSSTVQVYTVSFNPHDTVRLGLTALPNAAADAAGGLPISDAGGLDLDSIKTDTAAILVDTGTTLDGKINDIDTVVDAILVDTAEIGAAGAGLTAIPWNASWDVQVESEVADALAVYDPPTKAELDAAVAPLALEATLATAAAYIDTEVAAILVDTNELQTDWTNGGRLDLILDARASQASVDAVPTAAENADAVWDELIAGHADSGSTGEALTNAGAAGTPPTAAAIADAVWDEATAGHVEAGSTGLALTDVPTAVENADALLTRNWTSVTGEAARSVLNALRFLRNRWSIAGSTLTVTEEDDATTAWTSSVTTSSNADPVISSDPS